MSDSHGSPSIVGSLPILGPSPITLGSPPTILSPQSPPILGPSASILCGPSTVGSPTIIGSPSIDEVDRHPGLLDRMSNIGPGNTPNDDEKFNITNDEKFLKHNQKDKHTSAANWVFSWSKIVDCVLQIAGITAGIVFGVWVIKTYSATETSLGIAASANNLSTNALAQSILANQLALLSFCAPYLEAIPPSEFTVPCATVSKSVFNAVLYGHPGPQGVMPPATGSQLNPNTTNPLGGGGAAESGPYVAPHPSVEVDPQPTPSNSSPHGNQASADSSSSSSNSQALGPKTTSPHQKTTVRFGVLVGIIAAVVGFLVIVGALLGGRKRLKIRVRITTEYEC